jgi:hypothetical protein
MKQTIRDNRALNGFVSSKGYFGKGSKRNGPHDEEFFNCLMLYLERAIAIKKRIQDGE